MNFDQTWKKSSRNFTTQKKGWYFGGFEPNYVGIACTFEGAGTG